MSDYCLSKKKQRPTHVISYKCPSCGGDMRANIILSQPFQWWTCDECKKTFELSFRELEEKKKVSK